MIETWRRPDLDLIRTQLLRRSICLLTSVHPTAEKLYFRSGRLVFASDEAVALIDAFYRIDREYLYHWLGYCMPPTVSLFAYTCPTDQSAYSASYDHSQWMRGRSSARICQDLLHTLICNKVDAGADRIANYARSVFPRIPLVLQLTHADANGTQSIALPIPGA